MCQSVPCVVGRKRPSARRRRTAGRHGRALDWDIPCRVAPQQSSTPFLPARVILAGASQFGIPGGIVPEHGVEDDEQLTHAGGDDDFGLLGTSIWGALGQSLRKGADAFVAASGAESRHVQGVPDGDASAPDGSCSGESSAVVIEGRHADQCGDLLAVELSQFGEVGQEGGGGGETDAGDGGHEIDLVLPVVVITNDLVDLGFDRFDLFVESFEDFLNALAGGLGVGLLEAVGLGGAQIDQLPASFDELLELSQGALGNFEAAGLDDFAEACQDAGVDGIGLGKDPEALGEITDLAGIDEGHGMSGLEQFGNGRAFVATGGFEDNDAGAWFRKLFEQLREAHPVVGHGESFGVRTASDLEVVFGHIHTDEGKLVQGDVPILQIRARGAGRGTTALAAVRARTKRPITIMLGFGIRFTEGNSICGRPLARRLYIPRASPLPTFSLFNGIKDTRARQPWELRFKI
jgi:hypothetical protein